MAIIGSAVPIFPSGATHPENPGPANHRPQQESEKLARLAVDKLAFIRGLHLLYSPVWLPTSYDSELGALFGPQFFQFDETDPRKKLLFAIGSFDPYGAFHPVRIPCLQSLNEDYDIKYVTLKKFSDVCDVKGDLMIGVHGSSDSASVYIAPFVRFRVGDPLPSGCFSARDQEATNVLLSCRTASPNASPNFGEYFAAISGRTTYAPTDDAFGWGTHYTGDGDKLSVQFRSYERDYFPHDSQCDASSRNITKVIDPDQARNVVMKSRLESNGSFSIASFAQTSLDTFLNAYSIICYGRLMMLFSAPITKSIGRSILNRPCFRQLGSDFLAVGEFMESIPDRVVGALPTSVQRVLPAVQKMATAASLPSAAAAFAVNPTLTSGAVLALIGGRTIEIVGENIEEAGNRCTSSNSRAMQRFGSDARWFGRKMQEIGSIPAKTISKTCRAAKHLFEESVSFLVPPMLGAL